MFSQEQKESFYQISAPDGLKERILNACEEANTGTAFSIRKRVLPLVPAVACLTLCLLLFAFQTRDNNTLSLFVNGQDLSSDELILHPDTEPAVSVVRTFSVEPKQYTMELSANQDMEVVFGDGTYHSPDKTHVIWDVTIPFEDCNYTLQIRGGEKTYLIYLTYHAETGTFSIYYQTNE